MSLSPRRGAAATLAAAATLVGLMVPQPARAATVHRVRGRRTVTGSVLACMAFDLTRAAATLTGPRLAKATTAIIRRTLITVPARIAYSARRLTLHLPTAWPWQTAWSHLFTRACGPPPPATA